MITSVSESRKVFTGLSSDTKPTVNVPAYSKFLEQDTSDEYEYDGNSWVKKVSVGANNISESGSWSNKTATGTIKTGAGLMTGFYVNSTTSGTIIFYDATSATNAITGTITPAAGWHALPVNFGTGLHVVIANTLNVTIIYK